MILFLEHSSKALPQRAKAKGNPVWVDFSLAAKGWTTGLVVAGESIAENSVRPRQLRTFPKGQ